MTDDYRVQLDVFSGPMDLLLYLIRRDEIDVQDISISRLTDQYIEYVHLLRSIDPNAVGEFLVMASTLIELKSRALLPTPPLEALDEADDPRAALVRQLLEYKRIRDAARALGSAAEDRAQRFVRRPAELPRELIGIELEEVGIWDLLSAFNSVMTAIGQGPGISEIRYDDTPIETYVNTLIETLEIGGPTRFDRLFTGRTERAEVIGLFLAMLELMRRQRIRAEQARGFGEIYLFLLEPVDAESATALNAEERAALLDEVPAGTEAASVDAPAARLPVPDWALDQPEVRAALDDAVAAAQESGGPAYFIAESEEETLVVRLDAADEGDPGASAGAQRECNTDHAGPPDAPQEPPADPGERKSQ
ncbi:MAG: segregation/condensation protein A [Phycisphaerales bacterium]|nr:segregation/condensation protein A [Phycisphaerales bacterium]